MSRRNSPAKSAKSNFDLARRDRDRGRRSDIVHGFRRGQCVNLFIQKSTKHSRQQRRRESPMGQCELGLKFRGGNRRGAGRKNRSGLRSHVARPRLNGREPVHVTLKLCEGLPSLRRKDIYRVLRDAVRRARLKGLRLVHEPGQAAQCARLARGCGFPGPLSLSRAQDAGRGS
jgi:hypothetical protein